MNFSFLATNIRLDRITQIYISPSAISAETSFEFNIPYMLDKIIDFPSWFGTLVWAYIIFAIL